MASLSKQKIHDAGKRDPLVTRTISYKGKRAQEKWPSGYTESYVDPSGNVMNNLQLVPPSVPATRDAVTRAKAQKLHDGFVPHAQCPMRNGIRFDDKFRDEFADMPVELEAKKCESDPTTRTRGARGVIECHDACPHVEWLIAYRKNKAAEARLAKRSEPTNLNEQTIAAQQAALEEQKVTNARLLEIVSSLTNPKAAKKTQE